MRKESEMRPIDFGILDGKVEFPNRVYNGTENEIRQAVGLAIFRTSQSGGIEILMGKHRSPKNQEKHGKWGWLGETREEDDSGTLNTLYRLSMEELERNLSDFRLFVGQSNDLAYPVAFTEGERSYSAEMLVVCTDEDLSGHISDFGEIEKVDFFSLATLINGNGKEPLRGSVLPVLTQLYDKGAFQIPIAPLRRLVMPELI